jgi:hypothetical protein
MSKWHFVKKELPENMSAVLCYLKDGGMETAYYEDGEFTFCAPGYHIGDVESWTELPEEPKLDGLEE